MKKKSELELMNYIRAFSDNLSGVVNNQEKLINLIDRIVGLIEFLMKSVSFIIFILNILVWRVYLWVPFNNLLEKFGETWTSLSEAYKILFLGFVGALLSGIIAQVVGWLFIERLKLFLAVRK